MKSVGYFIAKLQEGGDRITPARQAIVEFFVKNERPVSVEVIRSALNKQHLPVNKTTVYREIDFLLARALIRPVYLDGSTKFYELVSDLHHHHVVCRGCATVADVDTEGIEDYLDKLERKIAKKINFKSVKHSLEFFGECGACQKKTRQRKNSGEVNKK